MTATPINILVAPAAAELNGPAALPGIPAGPAIADQSGGSQSFDATMQSLDNLHGDRGSGSLLPSDFVVTATGSAVPATMTDLALPTLPSAPMTGEPVTDLLDGVVSFDLSAGSQLPEPGNVLPPVAGLAGPQPSVLSDSSVTTMSASEVMLQQAIPEPAQAALTSVAARLMTPDRQLNPDVRASGMTVINSDESSVLMPQLNAVPEPELEFVSQNQGQVQRAFEALTMFSESAATGRAAENIMTMTADSGPVGFAQPTSPAPLQFDQLMNLPQFQNMRPLQPMADPNAFMEGLGQRLMVMSEEGIQSARLKLYPENLGTLDIKIQVEDNVARVWFTAEHGQAREALETALPKLKALFAQQGMELIQADVGSGHDRQRANEAFDRADDLFSGAADNEPDYRDEPVGRSNIMAVSEHSLDIYV